MKFVFAYVLWDAAWLLIPGPSIVSLLAGTLSFVALMLFIDNAKEE